MSNCDNCVGCPDDAEIHRLCDDCMQEQIEADEAAHAEKDAEIERLRAELAEAKALADLYRRERDHEIRERAETRAERDEARRERDARIPLASLPTEFVCGEWIMSGQAEPDAVVTYASEPSPETGHVGWCWWARGKMGEARDYVAAREAAEKSIRAHAAGVSSHSAPAQYGGE